MSFVNRIRLPLYLSRAQYPSTKEVYNKSNGQQVLISAKIKKTYVLKTDWMPEQWHERLNTALLHDTVNIEGEKYAGGVKLEKMDEIDWQEFLDYPTAPVNGIVSVDPFFAINANCQSCEEFTQVVAVDDEAGDVDEGETYEVDVSENDTILCQPATFEIVSFNSDYLENVSIDADGVITFTVKTDLVAINGLAAIKYRVTCANDQYDEADVYVNVLGTIEGCLAPTDLAYEFDDEFPTTVTVSWVAPDPAPVNGYIWNLYTSDNLVTPINTGTSAGLSAAIPLPEQGTPYVVMVQSDCDGTVSIFAQISFTSPVNDSQSCGEYVLYFSNGTGDLTATGLISYIDCNNEQRTLLMYNLTFASVCAMQHSPGDPVYIVGATTINYGAIC